MNQTDSIVSVTPRTARKFILEAIYAGLVPYVTASPGVGKSAICRSIAKQLNLKLIDHRLSSSIPEDMNGLAKFNDKGEAVFTPFTEIFPIESMPLPLDENGNEMNGWLLNLDELPSAEPDVLKAAYKLLLDRMVGQKKLHQRVAIVACGNLSTDRAMVNNIGTALQSRLVHIRMVSNTREWIEDVAIPHGYDERIIGFLSAFPDKLNDFDPKHENQTFCCERTWEFMDKLISDESNDHIEEMALLYAGTISNHVAIEFAQFCQVYKQLPSIATIVKDPANQPVPRDTNLAWALITSMSSNITEKNFEALGEYANRFDMTFRILFWRIVMTRHTTLRHHPVFANAMSSLSTYLHA